MMIISVHGRNIDMDMIDDLAEGNEYWTKCKSFLHDIKTRASLSQHMQRWLDKIENDYEDQHTKYCS